MAVGHICGGKLYEPIKAFLVYGRWKQAAWGRDEQGSHVWQYLEFGTGCAQRKSFRGALFCRSLYQDAQMLMPFARPDTVVVTNLGMEPAIDAALTKAFYDPWLQRQRILVGDHNRGGEELRVLKDFGFEQLPFKRFAPPCRP